MVAGTYGCRSQAGAVDTGAVEGRPVAKEDPSSLRRGTRLCRFVCGQHRPSVLRGQVLIREDGTSGLFLEIGRKTPIDETKRVRGPRGQRAGDVGEGEEL